MLKTVRPLLLPLMFGLMALPAMAGDLEQPMKKIGFNYKQAVKADDAATMEIPSASFRQTFCLNRGNPTQEGEQVGVAFLLVTFLWPRKEKSLAKPRSGGETPSRTESSRPAWRSHAIKERGKVPALRPATKKPQP